jgi:subtilisin family serine protease
MKINYLLILVITFISVAVNAQNEYYYYKGEKIPITINQSKLSVFLKESSLVSSMPNLSSLSGKEYSISRLINDNTSSIASQAEISGLEITIDNPEEYSEFYDLLKNDPIVKAIEYVIGDSYPVMVSNLFYVKLKESGDTITLRQIANNTKTDILRRVANTDKWYVLEATKESISNSLDVSNIFTETGYFDKIDAGFILDISTNCVEDTRFYEQWAIDNIGIDINACDAWGFTKGNNQTVVAVIDQGIFQNHQEFTGTNFTSSYNAQTKTSPALLYGDHGTHVAGIIASNHDQYQIAGVAPNASIMNVSHSLSIIPTISEDLAAGIFWAVQNGAHILSNSWGDQGGAYYNYLHSILLEDAIDYAFETGRDGLGCVVAFASGNRSPAIDYPAYYRPEILTVGSITSNGQRSGFSGYGDELDIVAPGSNILSTIPNNQYQYMNGTSMATPQVSAVAALILSINPDLSVCQVNNIIESTAQKVGGYSYQNTTGRANGTWNNQMGYGLVDAYAAVLKASGLIQNRTYDNITVVEKDVTVIHAGYAVIDSIPYGNVVIGEDSDVTFEASERIILSHGFYAELGSKFKARIVENDDCIPLQLRNMTLPAAGNFVATVNKYDKNMEVKQHHQESVDVLQKQIKVYPNPATTALTVSLVGYPGEQHILIYDTFGKQVISSVVWENQQQINISDLPQGMYIINIYNAAKELIYREKLMKE